MASETFIPFFGGMVNQGESYCQARIGFIGTVPVMFVDEDNRAFGLHWQKQIRTAYMEDGRMAYIEEIRGKGNPSPTGRDRLPAGRCSYCLQPFPVQCQLESSPTSNPAVSAVSLRRGSSALRGCANGASRARRR